MSPPSKPWVETPLMESAPLSKAAGCRIFLKLENIQLSGSFKARGIGYYMSKRLINSSNPDRTHFFSSSGGNAGLACVHAAAKLGHPATVIMPSSTKPLIAAKLRAAGAKDVQIHGASWKEADTYLRETVLPEAEKRGEIGIYVPPFDHPDIWTGHSWIVEETKAQLSTLCGEADAKPDVLVCSVGGGGLLNGLVEGMARNKWDSTTVLALETRGADSLAESVARGKHITLPGITSQATTLGAVRVSDKTYENAMTNKQIKPVVLSDEEAMMGCWRLAEDERMLVELSCGVNLALCYGGRLQKALGRAVQPEEKVVVIVCGGSNISIDMLTQFKADSRGLDGEMNGDKKEVPSTVIA